MRALALVLFLGVSVAAAADTRQAELTPAAQVFIPPAYPVTVEYGVIACHFSITFPDGGVLEIAARYRQAALLSRDESPVTLRFDCFGDGRSTVDVVGR